MRAEIGSKSNNTTGAEGRLSRRYNPYLVFLVALTLWVVVAVIDNMVTYEIALSIFYLIPISIAVAFSNFWSGVILSVLSAAAWYYNDMTTGHVYSSRFMPLWNASIRLGYFLLHSYFLSRYRTLLSRSRLQANTDALTGARNARFLFEQLKREHARAAATGQPLTVAYIDLDHFKAVNDGMGHAEGDKVLRTLAEVVNQNLSDRETFARIGGDEFVILMPRLGFEEADNLLRRIATSVADRFTAAGWPVTLSIGALTYNRLDRLAEGLIRQVDKLMYEVKTAGKNGIRHLPVD